MEDLKFEPAMPDIAGVNFNSTIIPCIILLLTRPPQKRHQIFEWLITIAGSIAVLVGTLQRVLQMYREEWAWGDEVMETSTHHMKYYYTYSLLSWIACIVMDGRHTLNICIAYRRMLLLSLQRLSQDFNRWKVLELLGLLVSLLSMIGIAVDVYNNFHKLTYELAHYQSFHLWFIATVISKVSRMIIQGLVILANPKQLMWQRHKTFTLQLIFSSVFLAIQVLFLAQFTSADWLSLLLLAGNLSYRVSQCVKIGYYWYYGNHDQETTRNSWCFVILNFNTITYREHLPCRKDYFIPHKNLPEYHTTVNPFGSEPEHLPNYFVPHKKEEWSEYHTTVLPFLNPFGSEPEHQHAGPIT